MQTEQDDAHRRDHDRRPRSRCIVDQRRNWRRQNKHNDKGGKTDEIRNAHGCRCLIVDARLIAKHA